MATRYPKRVGGFRSGLEVELAAQIAAAGHEVRYEDKACEIPYVEPEKVRRYKPDFVLDNGIVVEGKGRFDAEDRTKHLRIRDQFPEIDIRFVFTRSAARISKTSSTTLADWCNKHGFQFADRRIPMEWFDEPPRATHTNE